MPFSSHLLEVSVEAVYTVQIYRGDMQYSNYPKALKCWRQKSPLLRQHLQIIQTGNTKVVVGLCIHSLRYGLVRVLCSNHMFEILSNHAEL